MTTLPEFSVASGDFCQPEEKEYPQSRSGTRLTVRRPAAGGEPITAQRSCLAPFFPLSMEQIHQPANGLRAAKGFALHFNPTIDRRDLPVMHPDDHRLAGTRRLGPPILGLDFLIPRLLMELMVSRKQPGTSLPRHEGVTSLT